jgi:phage terminase large subunit
VVIEEHVHRNVLYDAGGWFKIFRGITERYRIDGWLCDPAQPAYITALRIFFAQKELVYEANNRRIPGIQRMKSLFYQKKLFILEDCKCLINEVQKWKFSPDKEDGIKEGDDAIDATRYAVMGLSELFDKGRWSKG